MGRLGHILGYVVMPKAPDPLLGKRVIWEKDTAKLDGEMVVDYIPGCIVEDTENRCPDGTRAIKRDSYSEKNQKDPTVYECVMSHSLFFRADE